MTTELLPHLWNTTSPKCEPWKLHKVEFIAGLRCYVVVPSLFRMYEDKHTLKHVCGNFKQFYIKPFVAALYVKALMISTGNFAVPNSLFSDF